MIKDKVKDNHAYLYCSECGAEHKIMVFEIGNKYPFPVINYDKTREGMESFIAKHVLCKKIKIQTKLEFKCKGFQQDHEDSCGEPIGTCRQCNYSNK